MYCPNCGFQNQDGFKFCIKCGKPMEVQANNNIPTVPMQEEKEQIFQTQQRPPTVPYHTPYEKPAQSSQRPVPTSTMHRRSAPSASFEAVDIWGPFAGYGTRRRHIGWLLDQKGENAQELVKTINDKFKEREIPGVLVLKKNLTAKGVIVESRPYFILKRNLISMALNVTKFGKDLYISLASYPKPPISNFRVIVLGAVVLFAFFMTFLYPNALVDSVGNISMFGSSLNSDNLVFLLCVIGPLGMLNNFLLFIFLLYSVYKWLKEKDFWAGLRVPPNEFNEDDLMAIEKAVEQTIRMSMDEIGLDFNDLVSVNLDDHRQII